MDKNQKKATLDGKLYYKNKRKKLPDRWKATPLYQKEIQEDFNTAYAYSSSFTHADSLSNQSLYYSDGSKQALDKIDTSLMSIERVMLQVYLHCIRHTTLSPYIVHLKNEMEKTVAKFR